MDNRKQYRSSEIALIGVGVEATLRRLMRFLVGKISLRKLHEMVDLLFMEELERHLNAKSPNGRATLSALALHTGYDSRVVNRIRSDDRYRKGVADEAEFLKTCTPGSYALHVWTTKKEFIDAESGIPRSLSITGQTGIEELGESLKLPRGVTMKTVITQLLSSGHLELSEDGAEVSVNRSVYLPSISGDREGAIEIGFNTVTRLLDTVLANLDEVAPPQPMYQRAFWTHRVSPNQLSKIQKEIRICLNEAEANLKNILSRYEEDFDSPEQVTVGASFFEFVGQN